MLFTNVVWRRNDEKLRKEATPQLIKRKFIELVEKHLTKMGIPFNIYETLDGDVIIAVPQSFRRHENRRINSVVEKIYMRIWKRYKPKWVYVLLLGPKAGKRQRSTRLTTKTLLF
jgi:hypothetical protein